MAANDILVKIGADITQFSRAMAESNRALSNFSKANKDTFGAFSKMGDTLTRSITVPAAAATAALTGVTLVKGFGRLIGIDTAQAKLSALGHSADDVEAIMTNALESVKGTSYGLDEAATIAANAVAAGVEPGKELSKYLTLTGDAAAIAGADLNEMGSIFNRVETAQRAYAMELNMLADRGIPIYQWLADEAGVSAEAVRDMAAAGEVSSEMYFAAIEKNIGGAAKTIGETSFAAALKNVWSDIARIGANFLDAGGEGEGFFSTLKPLLTEFRGYLETVEDAATDLGTKFGNAFVKIIDTVRSLKKAYDELTPAIQGIVNAALILGPLFLVMLGPILKLIGFIPTLIAGFNTLKIAFAAVGTVISGTALIIAGAIVALIALFVWAYNNIEWFREGVIAAWEWIKQTILTAVELIKEVIQMALEFIKSLWDEHGEAIIGVATTIWTAIQEAITAAITFIQDTVGLVLDKISDFWSSHGEFITSVAKTSWENLKNTVTTAINAVRGTIELVMGIIKGIFQAVWPIISGIVQVTWAQIKTTVSNAIELVSGIINTVMSVIQGDWEGAWNTIKDTASNIMDNIVNTFKGIDLEKIGKDVIDGLINGIKKKVNAVKDAVTSVTSAITGKIKGILGIKSPSRVLAQIGRWTGEGLANGITDTAGMVAKASELLADAATPEMSAIDLSYATPNGLRTSLSSAVRGTVDVSDSRDDALVRAIGSLERRLGDLEVVMDGRTVAKVLDPHIRDRQDSWSRNERRWR